MVLTGTFYTGRQGEDQSGSSSSCCAVVRRKDSEYDGFKGISTSGVSVDLEWRRFETANRFSDNYFSDFVDAGGINDLRGPETAQFGATLSLHARYFLYTRDRALLQKHQGKVRATAKRFAGMHEIGLSMHTALEIQCDGLRHVQIRTDL